MMESRKAVWTNKMIAAAWAAALLSACSPPRRFGGEDQSAGPCYLYE